MDPQSYENFVWRRLEEPLKLLGYEFPWQMWLVLLGIVLTVAFVYVVWMYIRDAATIGPWWSSLLGLLRTSVYVILSIVFMLPALQTYVESQTRSKVIVAFDISGSMATSDQLSTGDPNEKLTSRQEKVYEFLFDPKVDFFASLAKKNPVGYYRLGSRLDENWLLADDDRYFTRKDKETPKRDAEEKVILPEKGALPEDYWRAWLSPQQPMKDQDTERLKELFDQNAKVVKEGITRGTNLGDSLLNIMSKEMNNRLQGIVIFTDGRNTEGSPNAFRELESRAKQARIPIFVVGVGEDRQKVKIEIVDVRAPGQIQPEDKYRVKAAVTGEGLPGEKVDVTLEIAHVKLVKTKVKSKDDKGKEVVNEVEKEEELPIELIEAENPDNPKSVREKIRLGTKLVLRPATEVNFDKGVPPRVEIEWQIDATALAAAAKIDLTEEKYKGRKWEIGETTDDSDFRHVVKIPVDKREGLREKIHESTKVPMKVIKKPLRVLLLAAAANRDYQFVRSLLVREMEKKRMELAINLQIPPGEDKARVGVVQDVPPERLLKGFPDTFRQKKGDLNDLSSYDVIIGFDPDWRQLTPGQIKMVKEWSEKGGGLIMVGGHLNTVELIRPNETNPEYFKPLLEMLPVVLGDSRELDRKRDDPWGLDFEGANPEMEFLKLDEELDNSKFKEDWQAFFFGLGENRTSKAQRGFYSFYPVERAKTGSIVAARFADPEAKLKDNSLHPYIVLSPDALPRVIWLGSAESWRLREYREAFHERFWTKLVQYAAAKSKGEVIRPIRLETANVISAGQYMEVEAKIDGPDGMPLDRKYRPEITVKMPVGVPDSEIKQPIIMTPRPGAQDGWFSGRFLVRSPGAYELNVKVPRVPGMESDMSESAKFTVKEANPELDNTRPDYDRMYRMASEADEVMLRMGEGERAELKRRLQKPKMAPSAPGAEGDDKVEIREDKQRLYFDLKNADLIASCMISDVQKQVSRGKHRDLWDDGFVLVAGQEADGDKPAKKPIKLSYVLLAVVGLLSTEWLIRKLLRLA
jgi:hypothetical protein